MLLQAEEENDAKAAERAGAEQAAELAEFDENFVQSQASEYEVWLAKLELLCREGFITVVLL